MGQKPCTTMHTLLLLFLTLTGARMRHLRVAKRGEIKEERQPEVVETLTLQFTDQLIYGF